MPAKFENRLWGEEGVGHAALLRVGAEIAEPFGERASAQLCSGMWRARTQSAERTLQDSSQMHAARVQHTVR